MSPVKDCSRWTVPLVATPDKDVLRLLGLRINLVFNVVHVSQHRIVAVQATDSSVKELPIIEQNRLVRRIKPGLARPSRPSEGKPRSRRDQNDNRSQQSNSFQVSSLPLDDLSRLVLHNAPIRKTTTAPESRLKVFGSGDEEVLVPLFSASSLNVPFANS